MRTSRILLLLALLPACAGEDAGNTAFVQRAIPAVLGRKAKGAYEIQALVNIADDPALGREAVLDVLFAQPEYVDYWSMVLTDALRVRRSGNELEQNELCWSEGLLGDGDLPALAAHLQDAYIYEDFSSPWNMNDAVRAAITFDDLSVAWRAYLPALTWPMESGDKGKVSAQFMEIYLGRDLGCISCHSSSYGATDDLSAAGGNSWDRHETTGWAIEASLFRGPDVPEFATGGSSEVDYLAGEVVFQASCDGCHGADGTLPVNAVKTLATRVPVLTDDQIEAAVRTGPGAMTAFDDASISDAELAELIVYLRYEFGNPEGLNQYFEYKTVDGVEETDGPVIAPWGISAECSNGLETQSPDNAGAAVFAGIEGSTPDIGGLSHRMREGLDALPTELAAMPVAVDAVDLPLVDGGVAYAFQLAETVGDAIAREVTGVRPGLDHGFSRNPAQREARDEIVAALVVADAGQPVRLSLESALRAGLLEDGANAQAPASSLLDAYPTPMGLNPWAERDPASVGPVEPGEDANSLGDAVNRYSIPSLLMSTSEALLRESANLWPSDTWYSGGFVKDIGGYRSDKLEGRDAWDMQSLLYWEAHPGTCEDLTPADLLPEDLDWIDLLVSESVGYTLEDAFGAMRDRLLSDPRFATGEEDAIESLATEVFGVAVNLGSVTIPNNATKLARLETGLRAYCGALITSPQFTLRALPLVTDDPLTLPTLQICPVGEICDVALLEVEYLSQVP